jgi:hypothetical protein
VTRFQPTKRRKFIPQSNVSFMQVAAFSDLGNTILRNGLSSNHLKNNYFVVDCKSAYAGSIPTSASTLENPVD